MNWARYSIDGYEVSSRGDTRFSALFAKLSDGRTIEEAYQLDVKGYRAISDNWREGKGKAPLTNKSRDTLWIEYLDLWRTFFRENPEMLVDLREKAVGKTLTDRFATSPINQAHALSVIINEAEVLERLPFSF